MATNKVVKLDQIVLPESAKENSPRSTPDKCSELFNAFQQLSQVDAEKNQDSIEKEEARDDVWELPENWPNIPQLAKRRSCELTHATIPCVQKAISHLELIQKVIMDWFQKADQEGKRELGLTPSRRASTIETPYLGVEDVVEEVITLLARLEQDKKTTEERLRAERERVGHLTSRIDELCRKRLRDIPALVQREHEACLVDMNELQWHINTETRMLSKIKEQAEKDEATNKRLKEDLDFVKQHIPLLKEKLQLEMEAMEKIRKAQAETNAELQVTLQCQAQTEQKAAEALSKAEAERAHMKQELDNARDKLENTCKELAEAKLKYNSYIQQLKDIGQQLKDNAQEYEILKVKCENARVAEEMQQVKVNMLQKSVDEAEAQQKLLETENTKLLNELHEMKAAHEEELQKLENTSRDLEIKLREVLLKNQEITMEIQDIEDRIAQCEQEKIANEKNIARIYRDINRTETLLKATLDEHQRVSEINKQIREQLLAERSKAQRAEEALRTTLENLRRQIKEEIHARTVLQARIATDTVEIERSQIEADKRKTKADTVLSEVDVALKLVQEKVNRLRTAKAEKERELHIQTQRKENLERKIEETKQQHKETEERLNEKISILEPQYYRLKKTLEEEQNKLDQLNKKSQIMKKKMEEMAASEVVMNKVMDTTLKSIAALKEEHDELNIQVNDAKEMENSLRSDYNDVIERLHCNTVKHKQFMAERKLVYEKQEKDKLERFQQNKELASKYRQLQNEYVILKEAALKSYEERIRMETSVNDIRQLQALQKKMHSAMAEYFRLSGQYNEAELEKLTNQSSMNGSRVRQLQGEMEAALRNITEFLKQQVEVSVNRVQVWETTTVPRPPAIPRPTKNVYPNTPSK